MASCSSSMASPSSSGPGSASPGAAPCPAPASGRVPGMPARPGRPGSPPGVAALPGPDPAQLLRRFSTAARSSRLADLPEAMRHTAAIGLCMRLRLASYPWAATAVCSPLPKHCKTTVGLLAITWLGPSCPWPGLRPSRASPGGSWEAWVRTPSSWRLWLWSSHEEVGLGDADVAQRQRLRSGYCCRVASCTQQSDSMMQAGHQRLCGTA